MEKYLKGLNNSSICMQFAKQNHTLNAAIC